MNDRKVECSCHSSCFVWTDGTPNDFLTSWRPTEPDDGHGPGECAPKPGTPTPCHDDDAALWALGVCASPAFAAMVSQWRLILYWQVCHMMCTAWGVGARRALMRRGIARSQTAHDQMRQTERQQTAAFLIRISAEIDPDIRRSCAANTSTTLPARVPALRRQRIARRSRTC